MNFKYFWTYRILTEYITIFHYIYVTLLYRDGLPWLFRVVVTLSLTLTVESDSYCTATMTGLHDVVLINVDFDLNKKYLATYFYVPSLRIFGPHR